MMEDKVEFAARWSQERNHTDDLLLTVESIPGVVFTVSKYREQYRFEYGIAVDGQGHEDDPWLCLEPLLEPSEGRLWLRATPVPRGWNKDFPTIQDAIADLWPAWHEKRVVEMAEELAIAEDDRRWREQQGVA